MAIPSFLQPEILPYASVHVVRADGTVNPAPLVVVCAWHTTVAELLTLSRQHPGKISHALCEVCAAKFEALVSA